MSNDTLIPRIELLQEQIHNLENSGFFTEKEMDKLASPLRDELEALKKQLTASNLNEAGLEYGLTPVEMQEGRRMFIEIWKKTNLLINPIFDIEVIDAEILTPCTDVIYIDDMVKPVPFKKIFNVFNGRKI